MDAIFLQGTGELMIKKLSTYNVEYFFSEKEKMNYVVYGNSIFSYSKSTEFKSGLFLFGLVKKDLDNWLLNNPNPTFTENYPPYFISRENNGFKKKKYSYDINHCFWRIAFINGYISENTYNHGLRLKEKNQSLKQLYCMALSVQGQSKTLDGYIGTKKTGKTLTIQKNPIHKEIYNDIRNRTFKIMDKIAFELKADFLEYNVDCITFKMAKNCKIVEKLLTDENLQFKKI